MQVTNRTAGVLAALLLTFPIGVGAAEPPAGFRNFKWGSAPSGGLKKMADFAEGGAMYVPSGKSPAPLFGLPVAEEAYTFSKGKFYSGSAWLDGHDKLEKMKAALIKAYGAPAFSNDRLNVWKWKWPGSRIEVHLNYQAKFSRTTVTFLNDGI